MTSNYEQTRIIHGLVNPPTRGKKRTAEGQSIYDMGADRNVWKSEPSRIDTASTRKPPNNVKNPYSAMAFGRSFGKPNGSDPTASKIIMNNRLEKRAKTATNGFDALEYTHSSKYHGHDDTQREPSSRERRAIPSTLIEAGPSTASSARGASRSNFDWSRSHNKIVAPPAAEAKEHIINIDDFESDDAGRDLGSPVPRLPARAASEGRDEIDLIDEPLDQPSPRKCRDASDQYETSRTAGKSTSFKPKSATSSLAKSFSVSVSHSIKTRGLAKDGASTMRLEDRLRKRIQRESSADIRETQRSPRSSPPPLIGKTEARDDEVEEIEDPDGFSGLQKPASFSRTTLSQPQTRHANRAHSPASSAVPPGHVKQMMSRIEERSRPPFFKDLTQIGSSKSRIGSMKRKNPAVNSSNRVNSMNSQASVFPRDKHATTRTPYHRNVALPLQLCVWDRWKTVLDEGQTEPDYWFYWNEDSSELQVHQHPLPSRDALNRKRPVRSIKLSVLQKSTVKISGASDLHLLRIEFNDNLDLDIFGDMRETGLTFRFLSCHSNINECWESLTSRLKALVSKNEKNIEVVKGKSASACLEAALRTAELGNSRPQRQSESEVQAGSLAKDEAAVSTDKKQPRPRPAHGKNQDIAQLFARRQTRRSSRLSTERNKHEGQEQDDPPSNLDEIILIYPPSGQGAVNVTNGDLRRLGPAEFLNDTLIELGLKFWLHDLRESQPELAESIHVFSSFFFKKLASKSNKTPEDGHKSVRKWTAKVDIFKKKYIIVPINENIHWYLAIVYHPKHILEPASPKPAPRSSKRIANGGMSIQSDASHGSVEDVIVDADSKNGSRLQDDGDMRETVASTPIARENDSEAEAEVEGLVDTTEKSFRSCSLEESQVAPHSRGVSPFSDRMQQLEDTSLDQHVGESVMEVDEVPGKKVATNSGVVDDSLSEKSDEEEIDQLEEDDIPSISRAEEHSSTTPRLSYLSIPEPSESNPDGRMSPMDIDSLNIDDPATDDSLRYPSLDKGASDITGWERQASDGLSRGLDVMSKERDEHHEAVPTTNFYASPAPTIKTYENRKRPLSACLPTHTKQGSEADELDILGHHEAERESSEELEVTNRPRTIIFCMDSLGSSHPRALTRINEYLQEEAKDKKGITNPSSALTKKAHVPAQPNFCDCGLYLLHFAQTFISDPEKYRAAIFATKKTLAADRNTLWHNDEVAGMREKLKERILEESTAWKKLKAEKEQKELESKSTAGGDPARQAIPVEESDDEIEVSEVRHVGSPPKKQAKKPTQARAARVR